MVEKVEAAVDPEAVVLEGGVFLGIDRPVAWFGDDAADFWVSRST